MQKADNFVSISASSCTDYIKVRHGRAAGFWLFSRRRWLDPRSPHDLQTLHNNYDALCGSFPAFASVSRQRFLDSLTAVCVV